MPMVLRGVLVVGLLASVMLPRGASAEEPAPSGPPDVEAPPAPRPPPSPPPEEHPAAATPPPLPMAPPAREAAPTPPATAAGRWRYTAMLGVLAAPRPLALEPMGRYRRADDPRWDLFALGASIEYLPALATFDGARLSWMQLAAEGRWFPWRFVYVGLRAGWQFVRADSELSGSEVDYVTSGVFVGARVGALYTFSSGLTLGADLGATVPIAPKTTLESDGAANEDAREVARTFGANVMPTLGLVRVGYTF